MTTAAVSATSRNIMAALIAGAALSKDVAASLNVKTVVVTGSLAGLKKNGFVEVQSDGKLVLTVAGMQLVSPAPVAPPAAAPGVTVVATTVQRKGAMKAAAAAIVTRLGDAASRKDIVTAFKAELAMSDAQASTYHYNLCGSKGMWKA
jgi:hypothetical protein